MKNLASDPGQAATVTALFHELKKLQEIVGDKLVLNPAAFGIQA
jgi:hypothetical protein